MKFEEILKETRLPIDQEVVVSELEKVIDNPSALPTPELVVGIESATDQEIQLQTEREGLDRKARGIDNSYRRAKGKLESFKGAKTNIKDSLTNNADKLSEIGVDGISSALESQRLKRTDESKEYLKSRQALRDAVADFMAIKKELKQERFKDVKDLSFRAEERDDSINTIYDKVSQIRGSEAALARDKEEVLKEVTARAEESLRAKMGEITSKYVRIQNGGATASESKETFTLDKVKDLYYDALVKNGVEFGIEASERARKNIDFLTKDDEVEARLRIKTRESWEFKELEEGEKKSEQFLELLTTREPEVRREFIEKYGLDIDTLPINIQVIRPDGYQGIHSDEGKTVAYAFIYKGKEEYDDAEQKLETKKTELGALRKNIAEQEETLRNEMNDSPASFFNFSLKKKYKQQQEEISTLQKQLNDLEAQVISDEAQTEVLRSQINVEKVPLNILDLVDTVELVNYYYIHENYGRGYVGARQKNPMQTVGDFFRIFKEKREKEIVDFKEKQNQFAEEHNFALHEAFEEKKKRRSKKR